MEVKTIKKPVSVKFEIKAVKDNGIERTAFGDQTFTYDDGTTEVVPVADEDKKFFRKNMED